MATGMAIVLAFVVLALATSIDAYAYQQPYVPRPLPYVPLPPPPFTVPQGLRFVGGIFTDLAQAVESAQKGFQALEELSRHPEMQAFLANIGLDVYHFHDMKNILSRKPEFGVLKELGDMGKHPVPINKLKEPMNNIPNEKINQPMNKVMNTNNNINKNNNNNINKNNNNNINKNNDVTTYRPNTTDTPKVETDAPSTVYPAKLLPESQQAPRDLNFLKEELKKILSNSDHKNID